MRYRPAKFPAVSHLTLHFPRTTGEESSRISFIGFRGEYKPFTVSLPFLLNVDEYMSS